MTSRRLLRTLLALVTAVLAHLLAVPSGASAQERCVAGDRGNDLTVIQTLPGIGQVTYITRPHFVCEGGRLEIFADSAVAYSERGFSEFIGSVRYIEAERELRARRARYFSNEGRLQAEGNVSVVDPLQGSSIRNGDLVYLVQNDFRAEAEITVTTGADGVRPTAVLTPPERTEPDTAVFEGLAEPDSAMDRPTRPEEEASDTASVPMPTPYTVIGDRIFLRGAGYFAASGDVEIVRDSLFAYADSAEYDETLGSLSLVGSARVEGEAYQLTGQTIRMEDPGAVNSDIRALREAKLIATDVLLTAAQILVRLRDDAMERLVATPIAAASLESADSVDAETPVAVVEQFRLTADSLELFAPEERLQRVFASGRARSVSTSRDSLNAAVLPEIARNDWLEGDTVIIRFRGAPEEPSAAQVAAARRVVDSLAAAAADSIPRAAPDSIAEAAADSIPERAVSPSPADSIEGVVVAEEIISQMGALQAPSSTDEDPSVEEIIARVRARSLYRLPPSDSMFRAGRDAPAVHYVQGSEIRIRLADGEVRNMQVAGQTRGVHLEPLRRTAAADSIGAPADTLVVDTLAVDTLRVDTLATDTTTALGDTTSTPPDGSGIRTRRRPPTHSNEPKPMPGSIRAPEENPWIRR